MPGHYRACFHLTRGSNHNPLATVDSTRIMDFRLPRNCSVGVVTDSTPFSSSSLETDCCDLKVAEMIVCRKDQFIRRAVPSALPYEAWREGNDSSWNPPTTYPAIERSASEPRGDGAAASIKVARGQG